MIYIDFMWIQWKRLIIKQLYIQEKSKVNELEHTIHRLNLDKNLNQYLDEVIVRKDDFQYCYDTDLITTFAGV